MHKQMFAERECYESGCNADRGCCNMRLILVSRCYLKFRGSNIYENSRVKLSG